MISIRGVRRERQRKSSKLIYFLVSNHFPEGRRGGPLSLSDYVLMNYFVLMLNELLEVKEL